MKRSLILHTLFSITSVALAELDDTVNFDNKYAYSIDGITVISYGTGYGKYASVRPTNSTRLYDSTKAGPWTTPYTGGTEGDSLMCWTHAAANSIQYWQDVYGVFYKKDEPLPNGYYSTVELPSGSYDKDGNDVSGTVVNDSRNLNIAKTFYDNWTDEGGKFSYAAEWYFKGINVAPKSIQWPYKYNGERVSPNSGGYFDSYFKDTDSYVTIYSQSRHNTTPETSISTNGQYFSSLDDLKNTLITALGFDGSYRQTQEGLMPYIGVWDSNDYGHMLSCQGFTTDTNGNLVSILLANGDDSRSGLASLSERYVKLEDGKIQLYTDANCTSKWGSYYIGEVSYINTPEVLQNMLTEYRSLDEAAVWNGGATEWSTQVDVVDSEIADSSTGWDILVDGANIDEKHHSYYHGYALEGRNVEFGEHADANNRTVTVKGTVHARNITVSAAGYEFKAGEDAAIAGAGEGEKANLTITSGASLSSEVQLNLGDLTLENGAVLSSDKVIEVHGAFLVKLQEAATFGLARAAVTPEASVNADLDLRDATSITLNAEVNMNDHNLILSADTPITLSLNEVDGSIIFFTNIEQLSIVDGEVTTVVAQGSNLTQYFSNITTADGRDLSGYQVIYSSGTLSMTLVPEPTTATLSLLALAALATRRRRK